MSIYKLSKLGEELRGICYKLDCILDWDDYRQIESYKRNCAPRQFAVHGDMMHGSMRRTGFMTDELERKTDKRFFVKI